jgi:aconitate decarboxylase
VSEYTTGLAKYIANSLSEPMPQDLVDKMKLLVLDSIGCGLLGSTLPWTHRLIDVIQSTEGTGPSRVWGTNIKVSPTHAALINGTATHGFELDDVGVAGHHGSTTLTSALALVDAGEKLSGQELIRSIVTGIETHGRISECVGRIPHVTCGFHGPSVLGTFAAMATSAVVKRLDVEQTTHALGSAAQQTAGLMGTHHGGMGKRLLAGKAAQSGLFSVQLSAYGFTNVDNIFECGYGSFPSAFSGARDTFDLDQLLTAPEGGFHSYGVNFKFWAARVPIHPSMEAIKKVRKERELDPDQIEKVVAKLPEGSYRAVGWDYHPSTVATGQLNLQFCIATMLLHNDLFIGQFTEESIRDPRALDLIKRIEIVYDPELDNSPAGTISRETRLEFTMKDGEKIEVTGILRGVDGDVISREDIVEKFYKTTKDVLDDSERQQVIDICDRLETVDDVSELSALLERTSALPAE